MIPVEISIYTVISKLIHRLNPSRGPQRHNLNPYFLLLIHLFYANKTSAISSIFSVPVYFQAMAFAIPRTNHITRFDRRFDSVVIDHAFPFENIVGFKIAMMLMKSN
jgi:hypothetical protein